MAKYNIDSQCQGSYELSLMELCREIRDEQLQKINVNNDKKNLVDKDLKISQYDPELLRNKFKNSDGSGIIDKLKSKLQFDMEKIAGADRKEKYDMLRLLKILYYIEKNGHPKYALQAGESDVRIQITDILAKPSLENIPTEYSDKSTYGKTFQELFNAVKNMTPDAEERCMMFEKMNAYWEYITGLSFDYVSTDVAIENEEAAIEELRRIKRYLNEKVLKKMDKCPPKDILSEDGIMGTFLNILACHRILCNENDRIKINYRVVDGEPPSSEYADKTLEYDNWGIGWQIVDAFLDGWVSDEDKLRIIYLVTYGKGFSQDDERHFKYALQHAKIVAGWIGKNKGVDVERDINLTIFVAIIQEIMQIKKDNEKVLNDFYGYNNRYKSMMSAIKKPDEADAIIVQAWIRKLENRCAFNIGAVERLQVKRAIESDIFEIKKILFSYRNYNDIRLADGMVSHFAGRAMMARGLAMHICDGLVEDILKRLIPEVNGLMFIVPPYAGNVYDCFREIQMDRSGARERLIDEIVDKIKYLYEPDERPYVYKKSIRIPYRFTVNYGGTMKNEHLLIYSIDREKGHITFERFVGVMADSKTKRLKKIGLGEFIRG